MPHLPDELLLDLFELVPSRNDLTQVSYSCKTFATVVKPLLYSHVMIENKQQRKRLRNTNKENGEFVKKVTITGDYDPAWQIILHYFNEFITDSWSDSGKADDGEAEERDKFAPVGCGCVRELVEGKLFNVQSVEQLLVKNLVENPRVELHQPPVLPSIFRNLRAILIYIHSGGSTVWEAVLRKRYLPSLRHLAIHGLSVYIPNPSGEGNVRTCVVTGGVLSKSDLLDQLEILVSPHYPFLSNCPQLVHLATVSPPPIPSHTSYAIVIVGSQDLSDGNVVQKMARHIRLVLARPEMGLKYLSVETRFNEACELFRETMDLAIEKGVKVCYDSRDDGLIPQSFLDFLEEKKKREEEAQGN
ncbi:uncharacterized protein JCM6883_001220 [Sporobolomyces salmoneus]|uniref:uncharacterized protein n=1 Tax=Sporobolomyces salmoneus TaxID=183962 RepID=UPI00317BCB40